MTKPSIAFLVLLSVLAACDKTITSAEQTPTTPLIKQVTIVNYWAEWCKPCREEIPELNALAAHHPNIDVIAVNFDGLADVELATAIEEFGIAYPSQALSFGETLGITTPNALPTTVVLDQAGVIRHTLVGPQTEAELLGLVTPLL